MVALNSRALIYSVSLNSRGSEVIQRNCFRCGQDYFADCEQSRVCVNCKRIPRTRNAAIRFGKALTKRETQVVGLVADGMRNKEIATALHLSEGTIKVYISCIFDKIGIDSRSKLTRWALRKSDNSSQSE